MIAYANVPQQHCQQPLDITVAEGERVFFKVTGTHTVYLTGNYVIPAEEGPSEYDEDEDDATVSKKPPARRLRAGFLDDSDSDE